MLLRWFVLSFLSFRLCISFFPRSGESLNRFKKYQNVHNIRHFQVTDAIVEVLKDSQGRTIPFVNPTNTSNVQVDDSVKYLSDIICLEGLTNYSALRSEWSSAVLPQLADSSFNINNIKSFSDNTVLVRWNVTFLPDSILPLVTLGQVVPGWKLKFFDLLHRERFRSNFSWETFFQFWNYLLQTGIMRVPNAVIVGSSEFVFEKAFVDATGSHIPVTAIDVGSTGVAASGNVDSDVSDGSSAVRTTTGSRSKEYTPLQPNDTISRSQRTLHKLVSHKDAIRLVMSTNTGVLKNRKLALDMLQYLDSVKPSFISTDDWNDLLIEKVQYKNIPGMGLFDIDGLEAPDAFEGLRNKGYIESSSRTVNQLSSSRSSNRVARSGGGISWDRVKRRGFQVTAVVALLLLAFYLIGSTIYFNALQEQQQQYQFLLENY